MKALPGCKKNFLTSPSPQAQFLQKSVGGFLGVFGFLLSLILVPIFLFFFLKEGHSISENWSNYLPLRASPLKSEIVSLLSEINNYLINFFRGQLLVSLIDGLLIGVCLLVIVRLEFSLLIGLMVGLLGLIPYLGMMICWIPAVIIAAAQFGDWWHPVLVTIIFVAANNIDGMIIAPKIVGESVGLHPLTVIISVLAWSLILGGLLGALLAVPLTATLKVLLKRYFWDRPPDGSESGRLTRRIVMFSRRLGLMTFAEAEIKPAGLQPAHSKHVQSRAKGTVSQSILADPKLRGR